MSYSDNSEGQTLRFGSLKVILLLLTNYVVFTDQKSSIFSTSANKQITLPTYREYIDHDSYNYWINEISPSEEQTNYGFTNYHTPLMLSVPLFIPQAYMKPTTPTQTSPTFILIVNSDLKATPNSNLKSPPKQKLKSKSKLKKPRPKLKVTSEYYPNSNKLGRPGIDYPTLSIIPQTSFRCEMQRFKGFFADPESHCQVWHYCDLNGGQASFLCPNGTIFSQAALTCDWWYNVQCSATVQQYVINERLYKYILPQKKKFPEDYSGPLVDKYLSEKFQQLETEMALKRAGNKNITLSSESGSDNFESRL